MSTKFCNIHVPNMDRVLDILNSYSSVQRMSNFGPAYVMFRDKLHEFLGLPDHKGILPVSSGHIALMTALSTLGTRSAIVPAYTFSSTLQAASLQGIEATVVDVGDYPYLTVKELEKAHEDGIKFDTVIFVAPVSIIPQELHSIQEWCRIRSIKLVVDGAATFGTPDVCNLGDAYCLSFHATKAFPIGEGGAVILNKDYMPSARSYICFGMDSSRKIIKPGLNGKVSEYTAAIGIALLEEISEALDSRIKNSLILEKGLKDCSLTLFSSSPNTVYHNFPVYTNNAEEIINNLRASGFEVNKYYTPLVNMPNASRFYRKNVCLPCHPDVSVEELGKMIDIIRRASE